MTGYALVIIMWLDPATAPADPSYFYNDAHEKGALYFADKAKCEEMADKLRAVEGINKLAECFSLVEAK
jgi:hypothetical protein